MRLGKGEEENRVSSSRLCVFFFFKHWRVLSREYT